MLRAALPRLSRPRSSAVLAKDHGIVLAVTAAIVVIIFWTKQLARNANVGRPLRGACNVRSRESAMSATGRKRPCRFSKHIAAQDRCTHDAMCRSALSLSPPPVTFISRLVAFRPRGGASSFQNVTGGPRQVASLGRARLSDCEASNHPSHALRPGWRRNTFRIHLQRA